MKEPAPAPSLGDAFKVVLASRAAFERYLADDESQRLGPAPNGAYDHWDTFRHRTPPEGWTPEQSWMRVKLARQSLYQDLPLKDSSGRPYVFALPVHALEMLDRIDRDLRRGSDPTLGPDHTASVLLESLLEEAIASSQLDGAQLHREPANAMLRGGRLPREGDEQMIQNTFAALQFVRSIGQEPLSVGSLRELNRILTNGPAAEDTVPDQLAELVDFANGTVSGYIPPAFLAILLHFWLLHVQPFAYGNGRTARALFYWAMGRAGYACCDEIAISRVLKRAKDAYARSVLYTLTDENDTTYFVLFQLRAIQLAIRERRTRLEKKAFAASTTGRALERGGWSPATLNARQLEILTHAVSQNDAEFTVEAHRISHGIVYQTARTDLLSLAELGLLEQTKRARAFVFRASAKLLALA